MSAGTRPSNSAVKRALASDVGVVCRPTDAGQPSVEHVRGMFAAMHGPSSGGALGHMSEEEDAEYAAKQPSSQACSLRDV
jgi:hypothetical protein